MIHEFCDDANLTSELVDMPGAAAITVSDVSIAAINQVWDSESPTKTQIVIITERNSIFQYLKLTKKWRKEEPWGESETVGSVMSIGALPEFFFLFLFFAIFLRLDWEREREEGLAIGEVLEAFKTLMPVITIHDVQDY